MRTCSMRYERTCRTFRSTELPPGVPASIAPEFSSTGFAGSGRPRRQSVSSGVRLHCGCCHMCSSVATTNFRHVYSAALGYEAGSVLLGATLALAICSAESMMTHLGNSESAPYSSIPAPRHSRAAALPDSWRRGCLRYPFAEQGASGHAGWHSSFISAPYFRRA